MKWLKDASGEHRVEKAIMNALDSPLATESDYSAEGVGSDRK